MDRSESSGDLLFEKNVQSMVDRVGKHCSAEICSSHKVNKYKKAIREIYSGLWTQVHRT